MTPFQLGPTSDITNFTAESPAVCSQSKMLKQMYMYRLID